MIFFEKTAGDDEIGKKKFNNPHFQNFAYQRFG